MPPPLSLPSSSSPPLWFQPTPPEAPPPSPSPGKKMNEENPVNLFSGNTAVGASFVYMYSKCGGVEYVCHVFDEMPVRDVVVWTALVVGCALNGESGTGWEYLCEMKLREAQFTDV
ncbi:hypothetical protein ACS0TY_027662 [Phlomoides rotata]